MWFFKKKKSEREQLLDNKHEIEDMASSIDVLISIANADEELVGILKECQEKIKYFNPSINKDVLDLDKKISNRIGDLKIDINKGKTSNDYSKAKASALDLKDSLIVERASKANRRR